MKRLFDIVAASFALLCLWPILLVAALGIRLSSPGPVLFRAERAGLDGRPFIMHKFRTMRVMRSGDSASITAPADERIFGWGSLLRTLKVDELPQLWDVVRGEMSIVGPRPEDLEIVESHYRDVGRQTLRVLPGLASPGSILHYTHGELFVDSEDPEGSYVERFLPLKLELERQYIDVASFPRDLGVVVRTFWIIACVALGRRKFPWPKGLDPQLDPSR